MKQHPVINQDLMTQYFVMKMIIIIIIIRVNAQLYPPRYKKMAMMAEIL